jgi:hypothetical protein
MAPAETMAEAAGPSVTAAKRQGRNDNRRQTARKCLEHQGSPQKGIRSLSLVKTVGQRDVNEKLSSRAHLEKHDSCAKWRAFTSSADRTNFTLFQLSDCEPRAAGRRAQDRARLAQA